jgi:CHASE2 domain-containing sensor protein
MKRSTWYRLATVMQYGASAVLASLIVYCAVMRIWGPVFVLVPTCAFLIWIMVGTHIPWRDIEKEIGERKEVQK